MKKEKASNFKEVIFGIVRKIPKGKVLTYAEVARRAGRPNAARAVGSVLGKNSDTTVPCHRVIRSDGSLGGYNGLLRAKKETLLKKEGAI